MELEYKSLMDNHTWELVTYGEANSKGLYLTTIEGQGFGGQLIRHLFDSNIVK